MKKFIKAGIVIGVTGLLFVFFGRFLYDYYTTHVPPKLPKLVINNQKTPPASEELKKTYLSVWKMLFMEQNNISDEYFSKYIKIEYVSNFTWDAGESLEIHYLITVDWVWVRMVDSILIKLKGATKYLSDDEVKQQTTWNQIAELKPIDSVVSYNIAFTSLKKQCLTELVKLPENPFVVERDGQLLMKAGGTINYNENKCKQGQVRLSDGKIISCSSQPCVIY